MKITQGQIDASDVTTRLLFPTSQQDAWLPIERFAETIATARKKEGLHSHRGQEVIVYVLEGSVDHEEEPGQHATLTHGSVLVLTAHDEIRHELAMQRGRSARWLSMVVQIPPHAEPPSPSVQIHDAGDVIEALDGTVQRHLVGVRAPSHASTGLELTEIEFPKEVTAFFRFGKDQRTVAYVLAGSGTIGSERVELGHGALLENASGIAIHGSPGFRIALASVPRSST